jgi:hypothetical protein
VLHDPKRIPRAKCNACGRTCSRQTFSTSYYLKRRDLPVQIAAGLVACSAHRQIARTARCSKTSVTRQAERLGRHAILFHARCLENLVKIGEPVVHDHHETFIGRQDHALGVGTAVGARSWFLYDLDPAPHKGSGRRPDRLSAPRVSASAPYVRSIGRTLRALLSKISASDRLELITDGRTDYQEAAKSHPQRVRLSSYPNPIRGAKGSSRSAEAIARDHAMFPVDSLHQMIRHSCADHKRETIAFGRRLESIVGRMQLMAVWKNFIKARSERKPDRTTPAMRLELADSRWEWERLFTRRLFPARIRPSASALKLYRKQLTPFLPALNRRHAA